MTGARARGSGKFKKSKLLELAGKDVLMVGSGRGKYLKFCRESGRMAVGVDISPEYVAEASSRTGGKAAVADASVLPFPDKSFDTVTLWDVLEHVPDDCAALKESIRVARRNVLISVPAQDTGRDHSAGVTFRTYTDLSHRRYYNEQRLEALLSVCSEKDYTIEKFDRIRPALIYRKVGIPRSLLSLIDRLLWFLSTRSDAFMRNYFVELRLGETGSVVDGKK
jgi:ubiquinone/menaquinone biosynthesis C-methylase UbiE